MHIYKKNSNVIRKYDDGKKSAFDKKRSDWDY